MSTFPVDPPVTPAASAPEDAGAANRRELSQEEIATLPLQALLVRAGHITLDQLADALRENVATGRSVEDIALSRGWLSAAQLDALRAAKQNYAPGAPARSHSHLPRPPRPGRRGVCSRPLLRLSSKRRPHQCLSTRHLRRLPRSCRHLPRHLLPNRRRSRRPPPPPPPRPPPHPLLPRSSRHPLNVPRLRLTRRSACS